MCRWMTVFWIGLLLTACVPSPPLIPNQAPIPTLTEALTETPTGAPVSVATATPLPPHTITPMLRSSPPARATAPQATAPQATTTPATATQAPQPSQTPRTSIAGIALPDHVVVVVFENHQYSEILGSACCAYLNQQISNSALMTQSFAVTHPSEPNYLALFSGSAQGVTDDACPPPGSPYAAPNLGQQLIDAGLTFAGFSEDLPAIGSTACNTTTYARKHSPWVDFSNVPSTDNLPFSSFPSDFTALPTVSFVIPNLCHDMHDCPSNTGDTWMKDNLDRYVQWAKTNNSLMVVTFDEDDTSGPNQILTFFEGPMVTPGLYSEHITHYSVLRTLEALYGLPYAGRAASAATITDIFGGPASSKPYLLPAVFSSSQPVKSAIGARR